LKSDDFSIFDPSRFLKMTIFNKRCLFHYFDFLTCEGSMGSTWRVPGIDPGDGPGDGLEDREEVLRTWQVVGSSWGILERSWGWFEGSHRLSGRIWDACFICPADTPSDPSGPQPFPPFNMCSLRCISSPDDPSSKAYPRAGSLPGSLKGSANTQVEKPLFPLSSLSLSSLSFVLCLLLFCAHVFSRILFAAFYPHLICSCQLIVLSLYMYFTLIWHHCLSTRQPCHGEISVIPWGAHRVPMLIIKRTMKGSNEKAKSNIGKVKKNHRQNLEKVKKWWKVEKPGKVRYFQSPERQISWKRLFETWQKCDTYPRRYPE